MIDVKLRWISKPESLGEMIASQLEDHPSLCDVVFLCEDGLTGFSRWLLSPSSLLTELLPPPGSACCEKLMKAEEAKVYLSLPGVRRADLQRVLGLLLGSNPKMSPESLEVASMLGIQLRKVGVVGDMEDLVQDLVEEAGRMILEKEEEASEDYSPHDDLEEELEFSFSGKDGLVDEIISDSSIADVVPDSDGSPIGTPETEENLEPSTESELLLSTSEPREEAPGSEIRSDGGEAPADVADLGVGVSSPEPEQVKDSLVEEISRPVTVAKVRRDMHDD